MDMDINLNLSAVGQTTFVEAFRMCTATSQRDIRRKLKMIYDGRPPRAVNQQAQTNVVQAPRKRYYP